MEPLKQRFIKEVEEVAVALFEINPEDYRELIPEISPLIHDFCLKDLRFHDLRRECVSRLFEKGLSVPEVALVSGHKTWTMLRRYTHLKAQDIVDKLG